jgi:rubrerythrin
MSVLFSGNEIVDIAVKIEENGQAFYLAAAGRAEDENLAAVLKKLAADEVEHKTTFQALYRADEDYSLDPGYNEEVDAYIKAMASAQVFAPGKSVAEIARGAADIFEVLSLAMGAEKDSILYYSEMKKWVQPKDKDVIGKVIAEEKRHLSDLTKLYGDLKGGCCA